MIKGLQEYLASNKCFKLILGANNENYEEITKLVALYSAAGCRFFDLNASEDALLAAQAGLEYSGKSDCYLCISVGTEGDKHLSKYQINNNCILCGACEGACLEGAIRKDNEKMHVDDKKCIGCARCTSVCPVSAFESYQKKSNWENLDKLFPLCECVEFHMDSNNRDEIFEKWEYLTKNFKGMLSINASRVGFSDVELVDILKKMMTYKNPEEIMIQADGLPMSGGADTYNSTLQAVSCADLIINSNVCPYVITSGGTNAKTAELARMLNVPINGVAVGSYARKIVKDYVRDDNFFNNDEKFSSALKIASELVGSV
ncbi:4Fe-4S dicluster domain-containing protein [bacterium]|nr:4Fe-4S dicluster domain-containing protein [bacterium]